MSRTNRNKPYHHYDTGIPGWYKKITIRMRRHKQKQAVKDGKEIPVGKKNNSYYW